MIQSMTGFAAQTVPVQLDDNQQIHLTILLKTLNARYSEITCKLPYALSALEVDFIQVLKKRFGRGTIYLTISTSPSEAFKSAVQPSLSLIESYVTAIETIKQKFSLAGQVTVSDVIQLPSIFDTREKLVSEAERNQIFAALERLIDTLIQTRSAEGALLEKDILYRLDILQQEITITEQQAKTALEQKSADVAHQLAEIEKTGQQDALFDAKKAAYFLELDKMDVHEEIVRFKTHLHAIQKFLASPEPEKGKRLDFTLQEMMREANTLASKSPTAEISTHAISIKVELEKLREQIQNVV